MGKERLRTLLHDSVCTTDLKVTFAIRIVDTKKAMLKTKLDIPDEICWYRYRNLRILENSTASCLSNAMKICKGNTTKRIYPLRLYLRKTKAIRYIPKSEYEIYRLKSKGR